MKEYRFSKEKYLEYHKKNFNELSEHIQNFLKECDNSLIDLESKHYNPGWGYDVYNIVYSDWSIPCNKLEKYCIVED